MAHPDEFRELLFADVALLEGLADARQVAAALLKYWDRRDRTDTTLPQELAQIAGLTASTVEHLDQRVTEMIEASGGDPRLAVTRRGGLSHDLHTAVSRKDPKMSRHITQLGAGIRVPLRSLPKDRYLDFMPVGEGGMGIVYWAMDTELGRQVAFKVVRPPTEGPGAGVTPPAPIRMRAPEGTSETLGAFEELKARFLQEAWVTGGMEHPGIVPVYELGCTDGGVPYYTMRFVRGRRTLETAIEEMGGEPFEARISLLESYLKVCDAVSYAHSRGVVHRDLKPANVALGEYGETIVLDWGLAKLSGHPDVHASRWQAHVENFRTTTDLATMTSALGTPGYMAPEAAAGDVENVDRLSDVYSLGALLFEILTGRLPFEFQTYHEYATQVLADEPPTATSIDEHVPEALSALCAGALSKDRALRPTSVKDLAKGVRRWQQARAEDREVDVLLAEARGALANTGGLSVLEMGRQSERALAACQRIVDLRPGNEAARGLMQQARDLRDAAVRAREKRARRALVQRVAITAVVALAIIGVSVAYVLEQRRKEAEDARAVARQERDRAAEHRARAEEVIGFMSSELREALEPEGRLDILAKIGEEARGHYASIDVPSETPAGFRQRMQTYDQLGEVYVAQGSLPQAREVFLQAAEAADLYLATVASGTARFEHGRAQVNLASVEEAQGYSRRAEKRLADVLEYLGGARPTDVTPLGWDAVHVRALTVRSRAQLTRFALQEGARTAERALTLAGSMLDHEGVRLRHRKLAIRTTMNAARAEFRNGDAARATSLAETALADAKLLLGEAPGDLTLRSLHVEAVRALGWTVRHSSGYARAAQILADIRPEATALVQLRPDNYRWRRLLLDVLSTLGEAKSGAKLRYWEAGDLFAEAYAIAASLHERDPSNARTLYSLITLCDRRANAATHGSLANIAAARPHRREAAQFARKLAALDETNVVWRYLVGYTLGTSAVHLEREEALTLLGEARSHVRYAFERAPDTMDISDFIGVVAMETISRLREPSRMIQTAADAVDFLLRVAHDNPDAYWPVYRLRDTVQRFVTPLEKLGAPGKAELEREARRSLERVRLRIASEQDPERQQSLRDVAGYMEELIKKVG